MIKSECVIAFRKVTFRHCTNVYMYVFSIIHLYLKLKTHNMFPTSHCKCHRRSIYYRLFFLVCERVQHIKMHNNKPKYCFRWIFSQTVSDSESGWQHHFSSFSSSFFSTLTLSASHFSVGSSCLVFISFESFWITNKLLKPYDMRPWFRLLGKGIKCLVLSK